MTEEKEEPTDEELAEQLLNNFREENIDELSVPHAAELIFKS